jgi:hypothetical protein
MLTGFQQLVQMLEELEEERPYFMEDFDEILDPPLDEQFCVSSRPQSADM